MAKGNEKGHVENLVKRSQRTFLTPLPEVQNLDELNAKLLEGRSQISIATGGRVFLEENLSGSPKTEALAGAVVE